MQKYWIFKEVSSVFDILQYLQEIAKSITFAPKNAFMKFDKKENQHMVQTWFTDC